MSSPNRRFLVPVFRVVSCSLLFVAGFLPASGFPDPGSLTGAVLGEAPAEGSVSVTNATVRMVAKGAGLGGRGEQGYFAYTGFGTNDFDFAVRVSGLEQTALSARAGLMVRGDLATAGVMAAIVVTPAMNGVEFLSRLSADGVAAASGGFPANLPYAWLRLRKTNDVVTGFASYDGRRWMPIGRAPMVLTNALVGLAASSASAEVATVATFADWGDVTGEAGAPVAPPVEPPGPSSRRTLLAMTEIHYNPVRRVDEGEVRQQFVELQNTDFTAKEMRGHRLEAGRMKYAFPAGAVIPAGGYVVVAQDPALFRSWHPEVAAERVLGPWEGELDRDRDAVRLWSSAGALLLEVPYTDREPWPLAADGEGHTLVLARPSWGEDHPRAWAASQEIGGSPGRADGWSADAREGLRITEVVGVTEGGVPSFVEIFNAGADPAPLRGVIVAGALDVEEPKLALPDAELESGGRMLVEVPGGVGLPSPLFLRNGQSGRVFDAVTFRGAATNAPFGRPNLDRAEMRRLASVVADPAKRLFRRARLVISEVMYEPITGRDDDQYLEIWNPGGESVLLTGWRLADGVEFEFPAGRRLGPGERGIVARNAARLRRTYPALSAGQILGEFGGRLGGRGERLSLVDETGAVEFGFTYASGGEWPSLANGGGSSLELLHPDLDPDLGSSWAASDESGRAGWQVYEVTGLLDSGVGTINDVKVLLLGVGETWVDDVEFRVGGTNLLTNSGFETGLTGWTVGGTHERSGVSTNGGFGGSAQCLHLRSGARGDNGINSARSALRNGPRPGVEATLRLRARWLAGTRDLLFRVKGNYLELPVRLEVPEDLGTPGRANSRALEAPRAALSDLAHFPVMPAEGEEVRVTVRVSGDAKGAVPMLRYRMDPSTDLAVPLPMNDAGEGADLVAGDGVYAAAIPGSGARTMAAFHVTLGPEGGEFRVPRTTPGREALVRWGDPQPAGNLGTYRIWITRATETRWNARARLHNGDLDATFVYGTARAVYGLGALYSGSPFVSPGYNGPTGSTLCGYVLHFPDDEPFLGDTDFVMDWPIRDNTRQLEQRAYEFAADIGVPYLHRRFVHMYVNGTKRGAIYEDTQQPGSSYLRNWSPGDDDGNLHKIEDWFEFSASGDMEINTDAQLQDFRRTDGSRNTARYRWTFRPRAVQESAHDFSALFRLVDVAVQQTQLLEYQRNLEGEMDIEEWAGVFAVEHAVGNWDSFGYNRGKNMYAYRPQRGPWRLYMWDIDFVMSANGEGPRNFVYSTIDPTISQLYQYPPFERAYWRAMKKLVDGPMTAERFGARLDAVRAGLIENGISASGVSSAKTWIRDQRASLLEQLQGRALNPTFTVESGLANGATTDAVLALQGQAPLEMRALRVNGEVVPVTWVAVNRWFASVPLRAGLNAVTLVPVGDGGRDLPGTRTINARLTEPPASEEGRIVVNEIHVSPRVEGGGFVEFFNPSFGQSMDLSGMQLLGAVRYDFPANTVVAPRQFLVLASSIAGYQQEFGGNRFPAGLLEGLPRATGDTLALVRPAAGTNPPVTVTAVTYRDQGPWPALVPGRSWQLRDPSRGEDDRVGAWGVYSPPTNVTAWKEFSVSGRTEGTNVVLYASSYPPALAPNDAPGRWSGTIPAFQFRFVVEFTRGADGALAGQFLPEFAASDPEFVGAQLAAISLDDAGNLRFTWTEVNGRFSGRLDAAGRRVTGTFTFESGTFPFNMTRDLPSGMVLLDDLKLVREGEETNLLRNGDFEAFLGDEWRIGANHVASTLVPGHPAGSALRLMGGPAGDGALSNAVSQAVVGIVPGETYRLSGRYLADRGVGFVARLEGGPVFYADLRPRVEAGPNATPGRPNSVLQTLDPIPLVWANEVLPAGTDGLRDGSGEAEPWVELHNSGPAPVVLDGYALSDDPGVPGKWAFPTGTTLPAGGYRIVWLDGETAESAGDELHASFRPLARDGVVVLSQLRGQGFVTVDYLRYGDVPAGRSYGHQPETWVHADEVLPGPTPAQSNGSAFAPAEVRITEWMASNDGSVRDPADLDADDWFEIYNPGVTEVDLDGWFLTDTRDNPTKFRVPAGYRVPPGGYLLVWADEEGGQNQPGRPDLHANFRLAGGGEEIAVHRPDGTLVDRVVFGQQVAGVSQGRRMGDFGGNEFVSFATPTPGRDNVSAPSGTPDLISVERRGDGALWVRFESEPGGRYRLLAKDDLSQRDWTPSTSTITAAGPVAELAWPGDGASQRFLRVERLP